MAKSVAFRRAAQEAGMDEERYILSRMATNFVRQGITTDDEQKNSSGNGQVTSPAPARTSVAFQRAAKENGMDEESYVKSRMTQYATRRFGVEEKDLPDLTKTATQRATERREAEAQREYERYMTFDVETSKRELEELSKQLEQAKWEKTSANLELTNAGPYGPVEETLRRSERLNAATKAYDELNKRVTELNRDIRNATLYQDNAKYRSYLGEQDFAQYTTAKETPDDGEYMTAEELGIYNYVLHKYGEDSAAEFMEHLQEAINYRKGTERGEEIMDIDNDVLRFLALGGNAVGSGFSNFGRGIQQLFNEEALPTSATQYKDAYISEKLGEEGWEVPYTDRTLGQLAYEGTSTITNMVPSYLVAGLVTYATGGLGAPAAAAAVAGSAAGSAALGLSAAGNAYNDALKDGYTKDQARTYGTMIGASEASLQYLLGGISKLSGPGGLSNKMLSKVAGIENGLLRAVATGGVMYGAELTEEELQLWLEPLYRTVIFDEKYDAPEVEEIVYTAAVTLLTTGTMNAGEIISTSRNNFAQNGNQISTAGIESVQALIESGLESDQKTESYKLAEKLQNKINNGQTPSEYEIGRLQQLNAEAIATEQTSDPLMDLARETVAEASQSASDPLMDLARETVAERETSREAHAVTATEGNSSSNVPYNVLSMENPVRKARDNAIKNTGYGENGMKAFTMALDSSDESVDQVRAKFQTAYELGRFDTPREKVELVTDLQKIAYNAGRLDHIADLGKQVNTTTAGAQSGFDTTGAPASVTSTQARIVDDLAKALGTTVRIGKSKGNAEINSRGEVIIADDFQTKIGGQDVSIVYHAAHEIGMHRLMQLAPTEGRAFMNAMYNYMSEGRPKTAATLIEEKQSAYAEQDVSLTTDKAAEEVVANNILSLYENEEAFGKAIRRIAEGNDQQAKRGLKKFREILGDIVKKLRDVIAKLTGKEKAEAQHALSEVEHLREMYENALAAAVEKNKELTAEKNATPESDGDVQYSTKREVLALDGVDWMGNFTSIKDQLEAHADEINEMKPVAVVEYVKMTRDDVEAQIMEEVAKIGGQKMKRGAVVFDFDKQGANNIANHAKNNPELQAAALAAPYVAKYGKLISGQKNHENTGLTTLTYAAPVIINEATVNAGVVIQFQANGRPRAVNVGLQSGGAFKMGTTKAPKGLLSRVSRYGQGTALTTLGASTDSVAQVEDVVNEEMQYSLVTDKKTLDFLDNQKLVKVYRAMQEIDGKLYPPMAAITKGQDGKSQLVSSTKKGAWYQSDERPDLIKLDKKGKPYFELKKGNGKMVPAAYNPYFHTSVTPLNDQFSSAFDRPNLVVVEGYIPESELTSGYKAQYAKDSVGETTWHAGPVASKLKGDKARRVFLSRWFKAERVVPVEEVARTVAKTLDGEGVSVPWNVVTPSLREALEKQGVEIDYKDIKMGSKVVSFESTQEDVQHSLKDSTGRTLSPGQQEYFKDSKVRDEDGNLKVVYHGSPADFNTFSLDYLGTNGTAEGYGFYFTDKRSIAEGYSKGREGQQSGQTGKLFEVYLDIKKPLSDTKVTIPRAKFRKFLTELNKLTDEDGEPLEFLSNYGDVSWEGLNAVLDAAMEAEYDGSDNDVSMISSIINGFGQMERVYDVLRKVAGYDGIIVDNASWGGDQSIYITFRSEQAKNVDNLNPTDDPDIRFSLKTARESSKNLLAIHNKDTESIMAALDLGGFPMPSIAIVKNDVGHEEFGDISVLFRKDTIDPRYSRRNKVYGADAWTPTKPAVGYKVSDKVRESIRDKVRKLLEGTNLMSEFALALDESNMDDKMRRWDGDFKVAYGDNPALKIAYLKDVGVAFNPVMKDKSYSHDADNIVLRRVSRALGKGKARALMNAGFKEVMTQEPLIRKLMNDRMEEQGAPRIYDKPLGFSTVDNVIRAANNYEREGAAKEIDTRATKERLEKKFTKKVQAEYEAWLDELSSGIIEKKGLRNNEGMFTPSGKRRSFEQLYMEFNLDNIVKAMAEESEKGGGVLGTGNIFGAATKEYSSIADIKADSGRLVKQDEETHKAEHDAFVARLHEITNAMITGDGGFGAALDAGDAAVDALLRGKTVKGILRELKSWRKFNATEQIAQDIYDLAQDISEAPTTYFEAKPRRAVGFDEVAAVVMPRNSSAELKARLEGMGIQVLTYNPNKEGDRLKKINSVDDISFSLKEQNDLLKENAKLKEVNEGLREQLKTTTFAQVDKKSLDKFTKALLKDYQSGADINEIRDALSSVYTYMANGEDGNGPAWNDLQERAYNVAVSILENASTVNDEMYQAYKGLRDRLRNYPISINKEYDNDIQGYESINDFRKANFGRLKITNDGTPVDIVYADLANTYPEFFDESEYTTQADQLTHIADVLDSLQPYEVNPYSNDMRRAATWLASDIIERFYELPQAKPTFADKQAAKLTKQVIKDAKKLENLREKKNERIRDLIQKNREKVKATTQKEREKRVEAVKEIKDHYKQKEQKASESRKARELRAKIMRHAQDMSKKLLKPTDKQHIPQKLQGAVAKLLESINLESKYTVDPETGKRQLNGDGQLTKRSVLFKTLHEQYTQMAGELVIDPDLMGDNGLFVDVIALGDKRIADMNSEELETVYRTLRAVEASISSANKAFNTERWESIHDAAENIREDNKNKREPKEYRFVFGWLQNITGLEMMKPVAFFHRLGESGDAIFKMMSRADKKWISYMKAIAKFTKTELKDANIKKWEKELKTVKLGGENVQLTTAQIMELYVLTKRKQAIDHIFMGGILPESIEKGIAKITRAEPVRGIDIGEVSKAISLLTAEQKAVADKLQKFASTELSKWGNEASMQVYNYEKFTEEIYWPIRSNKQETESTVEGDTQVVSFAGKGFTKNTKPNANTSVKIGSIFDTFAAHSSEMARYAAWLATSEDINRIRNYQFFKEGGGRAGTVKGIIDRVHGSKGSKYVQKLLVDISQGVGMGLGNEGFTDALMSKYKASAIGANLRVIVQQPTSLFRALSMIDGKYFVSVSNPLDGWKKALEYAPIAQWKDWGYFDINTGRQMKDVLFDTDTAMDKVTQLTMAGAGMADSVTWGTLWNAVENEVKANNKSLVPDSKAFYETVADRFTDIIEGTQVVDGVLQRSQMMRNANSLTKMATSFMPEPTTQYNMLMTALYDFQHTEGRARTAARKMFARVVFASLVANVANAIAQSLVDAERDDDKDKEYWEKWWTAFIGLEGDEETMGEKVKAVALNSNLVNAVNPLGYIPFVKDVLSMIQGYDVSRMDMESIGKTISALGTAWKALSGEGKHTVQSAMTILFAETARLFGLPVANLRREVMAALNTFATETDNYLMQYQIEKFFVNVKNSSGGSMDILYRAYTGDKKQFSALYAEMLKEDEFKTEDETTAEFIAKKLKDKVVDDLYELYKTDAKAYEEMYNDLIQRDFLKTGVKTGDKETDTFVSTAEKIAGAMEKRMKDEQGVTKDSELEKRYFGPEQQREYDRKLKEIQSSSVWKSANEDQREKLEDNLRGIVNETDSKMLETIAEGAEYGLDDTEYLLYKLALETVDQPSENGNLGSYSNAEKAAALTAAGLGDSEIAYLWNDDQALEAFGYGIDMDKYITFKSEIGNIKADKDRNGKTISGSRKDKIIAYLNSLGLSYKEYLFLLGTEYDLSKDRDYQSYFGK